MTDLESLARSVEGHMDRLKADLQQIEENGVRKGRRTPAGPWEDRTEQAIHDQGNLVTTLEAVLDLILKVRGPRLTGRREETADGLCNKARPLGVSAAKEFQDE